MPQAPYGELACARCGAPRVGPHEPTCTTLIASKDRLDDTWRVFLAEYIKALRIDRLLVRLGRERRQR